MARSLRSTRGQANKSVLRKKIFSPIEHARAERLSAKLLELAKQPKPERTEMEVEKAKPEGDSTRAAEEAYMKDAGAEGEDIEMDDAQPARVKKFLPNTTKKRKVARSHKVQKRRAKNSIVFPKTKLSRKQGGPGLKKGKRR
ncbi:MAG: hypothetical protein M1821_008844 [Bathelium mastoideum]|nr:MAG: hypothetical protein M1821_008844 [Bathelium mastoideum]